MLKAPLLLSSFTFCSYSFSNKPPIGKTSTSRVKVSNGVVVGEKSNSPKLVTFIGKGGSGKTTSAVFAAKHYAMSGLKTCLVIHSQDPTVDYLLNCRIGVSPIACDDNLSAVRFETTKMLLDPLNRLKQADARINMTQGVLEGVVGEELGVLPGMDSIFSALALERLIGFLGNASQQNQKDRFDVIVYDGISSEETVRMVGASSKARLYLKYLRNLAEKTDLGRLAGPSILRLAEESVNLSGKGSQLSGRMSSEIWNDLEQRLERGAFVFSDSNRFNCYLVMDINNPISVNSALRFWGCTIQAGAQVSGALGIASPNSYIESKEIVKEKLSPLPFSLMPTLLLDVPPDWEKVMQQKISKGARESLSQELSSVTPPVKFDVAKKTVTLLMPGFDKSEIKLFQFRGGSELLVEAGDQRRVIRLPAQIQGKVGGAKFIDRSLVITLR